MLEGEAFNLVYCFPNAISMSLCIVMLEAVVEAEASETITELLMLHNVKNAQKKCKLREVATKLTYFLYYCTIFLHL